MSASPARASASHAGCRSTAMSSIVLNRASAWSRPVFEIHATEALLRNATPLLRAILQRRRRGLVALTCALAIATRQPHVAQSESRHRFLIPLNVTRLRQPRFKAGRSFVELAPANMQESQPHRDETGRGWIALREIQTTQPARDRRIEIAGQRVETCEVPGGHRVDRTVRDGGGKIVCLLSQCARLLEVAQLELDVAKMAPDARCRDAEIPGQRQLHARPSACLACASRPALEYSIAR